MRTVEKRITSCMYFKANKQLNEVGKMKYQDKTDKFNTCAVASKTCKLGGWCSSCMYAYPGNAAISGKPESYKDVCTMSEKN